MRRIPRSSRPIDFLSPSSSLLRTSLNPPTAICFRATPAPFSTTSQCRAAGIMDSYKSKQKHQAFVRKWQKRLLGESEPIGAHVDPYDATSPVRIAPEEMGSEEEVLDEESIGQDSVVKAAYVPATSGKGLERVGGVKWRKEREEEELRELYWEIMGREVAEPQRFPVSATLQRNSEVLGRLFHQAVVEVYTLTQVEKASLDLTRHASQGRYEVPEWIYDTPIHYSRKNGLELGISEGQKQELLQEIKSSPATEQVVEKEIVAEDLEDPALEHVEEVVGEVDPVEATEAAKSEKKVEKVQKKSFDFMANRQFPKSLIENEAEAAPAPATTPIVEEVIAETIVVEPEPEPVPEMRQPAELVTPTELAAVKGSESISKADTPKPKPSFETIYSRVPLTDHKIKFALAKRLITLTGHRISDPALHTSSTLGDLLSHLLAASKPKASTLHQAIKLQRKDILAQKTKSRSQLAREGLRKMESLLDLPNVQVSGKKVGLKAKEKEVGRWKVIEYALTERDLPIPGERRKAV